MTTDSLTLEQKQYIIDNHILSNKELSKILKVNEKIIGLYKNEQGLSKKQLLEKKREYILNHLDLTNTDLAEILKMDRHTVGKIKKEAGANFTTLHNFKKYDDYIADNYYKKTAIQLAEEIGCSKSYVTKVWREKSLKGKGSFKYYCDDNFFKTIDTSNKAYILGFLAADGCIYKRDGHQGLIQISINQQDQQILEDIKKEMQCTHPINQCNNMISLSITSDIMFNDLVKIGITQKKTWNLDFKKISEHIPNQFFNDFIRGYFDGDGCITSSDNYKTIACTKITIAIPMISGEELKEILLKKKIICHFYKDMREEHYNNDFGSIVFNNTIEKYTFLKWIYLNCDKNALKLNRKFEKAQFFIKRVENNETNRSENHDAIEYWQLLGSDA